jgi:hypothetical protein
MSIVLSHCSGSEVTDVEDLICICSVFSLKSNIKELLKFSF